jgi:uncharacterized RDD family membrane protein YckC
MSSMPPRGEPGEWGSAQQSGRPDEWSSTGTQQGMMPGQQDFGSIPGQQGSIPGQQGSIPGQQGSIPGQQPGGAPGQWSAQPGSHSPVSKAETRVTGRRIVQYAIDYVLSGIIPGLAYWLLDRGHGIMHGFGWVLATVISIVVLLWYWVIRPHQKNGQTFGMQLLRLRVISKHGGPANMTQLFIRAILLIIDDLFFGLVALVTMMCSRYRQRVGDHMARTIVISARSMAGGGGMYAGSGAGYQPQPGAGYQPQPGGGYQPQPGGGRQPQFGADQPQFGTGQQQPYGGEELEFGAGKEPPYDGGDQPQFGAGQQPPYGSSGRRP